MISGNFVACSEEVQIHASVIIINETVVGAEEPHQ